MIDYERNCPQGYDLGQNKELNLTEKNTNKTHLGWCGIPSQTAKQKHQNKINKNEK